MNVDTIIRKVQLKTNAWNVDNISRTYCYGKFYERNPEIRWAFLASMVSRNAGWCMTDLLGTWYLKALTREMRYWLFLTYEKANWLIFSDAYPQLLIYELSKKYHTPLFHLLRKFHVSTFMMDEWERYFVEQDGNRLLIALIMNEQNLIQDPVINEKQYKLHVFKSFPYRFQDFFHFSTVLFPTLDGELYGCSVQNFQHVEHRIKLGKCLANILFHPLYYEKFRFFRQRLRIQAQGMIMRNIYPFA